MLHWDFLLRNFDIYEMYKFNVHVFYKNVNVFIFMSTSTREVWSSLDFEINERYEITRNIL